MLSAECYVLFVIVSQKFYGYKRKTWLLWEYRKSCVKKSFRDKIKKYQGGIFSMGKKVEKEKNEIVEEFFRRNAPKDIKSMNDMYTAWKSFFAPAFQQLLDAEMETKLRVF